MTDTSSETPKDRYISFIGLDCDAKARQIVAAMRQCALQNGRQDPFWDYFSAKLNGTRGPAHDELYHVHSNLNDLRDLLDRWGEADLALLLESLEIECC